MAKMKTVLLVIYMITAVFYCRGSVESNSGELREAPISYTLEVTADCKIFVKLKNNGSATYYLTRGDAPWTHVAGIMLFIYSEANPNPYDHSFWEQDISAINDPAYSEYQLKPNTEIVGEYNLQDYYPKVGEISKNNNIYLNWSFKLRLSKRSWFDPKAKLKNDEIIETTRTGGFLYIPKNYFH